MRSSIKLRVDILHNEFSKILRKLDINGRKGIGFYTLRRVFRTISDGSRDRVSIDLIMGHSDPSMGALYREHVEDERLQAVVNYVREWLFVDNETRVSG